MTTVDLILWLEVGFGTVFGLADLLYAGGLGLFHARDTCGWDVGFTWY